MKIRTALAFVLSALSCGASTHAATLTQAFQKDAGANVVYLWSDDISNMTLGSVNFGGNMQGWTVQSSKPGALVLSGPTSGPAGTPAVPHSNNGNAGSNGPLNSPAKLAALNVTGSPTNGRFDLVMNYKTKPFKLEWATVFFDNVTNVVRGFGTLTFAANGWSNATASTHLVDIPVHPAAAAMPVPSSVVFMLSALGLLTLDGLRRRATV